MIDNTPVARKSYASQARAFREQETMAVHRKNLARSVTRGNDQHQLHDVRRRWDESPALLKSR